LKAAGGESASLELRLDWMDAFLPVVDFAKEGPRFLNLSEERLATRFINLWSERAFSEPKAEARKQVRDFLKLGLKEGVFSRLVRACVELSIDVDSIEKEWGERFKNPKNRAALLMYAEEFAYPGGKDAAMALNPEESVALSPRIFGYLESLAKAGKLQVSDSRLEGFLKTAVAKPETGLLGALRVLRAVPFASFKEILISALGSKDDSIRLNALIAAKAYPASRELSEVLIEFLNSGSEILRGRALDTSLAHTTLIAKRAVIRHLKERILDEAVVDKIYRDFDPEKKGGEEFFREVSDL
jgi:hypothetical protein